MHTLGAGPLRTLKRPIQSYLSCRNIGRCFSATYRVYCSENKSGTTSSHPSPRSVPEWARPKPEGTVLNALTCQTRPINQTNTGLSVKYNLYLELSKPRLTWLVVLSTMSAYALAPNELSLLHLAFLTAGTALCSASANAINMGREGEFDRQMTRTRQRPVASERLTSTQAFQFAAISGTVGTSALYFGVSPLVAALGLSNIALYGWLYTSLKRKHISNTWVGAIVGAIPPLMGWGACSSLSDPGVWMLAGLLYSWQFPHFMSLSYSIADEYKKAGYVMSAWTDPLMSSRVSLRHSVAMVPLCVGLWYFGVTDAWFIIDSSIVNGWLIWTSFLFWKQQRNISNGLATVDPAGKHKQYARQLFWASVIHLPAVLVLAMIHKKGRWDWIFGRDSSDEEADKTLI